MPTGTRNQFPSICVGDVVEYKILTEKSITSRIGVVYEEGRLHPLCRRPGDDDFDNDSNEICLFFDDEEDYVLLSDIAIVSYFEDIVFSQRTIEDRISNPHGEHSEDVYILEKQYLPLPERIKLPFKKPLH
jgi:hypothetical protein